MSKWWIGAFLLGATALLLGLTIALDHGRAGVRVTPGIDGLVEVPAEDGSPLAAAAEDAGSSGRTPATRRAAQANARELEVLVRRADSRPLAYAEVLAYRGEALRSAGKTDEDGRAQLLAFQGPAELRVRIAEDEIARARIPSAVGRHEVLVPDGAVVAGIVYLDGAPRASVWLELVTGPEEGWAGRQVREALENLGLSEPRRARRTSSAADGSFRFEWLPPDWSGSLRLAYDTRLRFADGTQRLALAGPDDELEIEIVRRGRSADLRCRAVLDGVPVRGTSWQAELVAESWSSNPFGVCDDEGRFVLPIDDEEARVTWLELYHPEAGRRMLRAPADRLEGELGDVELVPHDALPFVVRTEDGAPVAGATATTIEPERFRHLAMLLALRGGGSPHCTPSGPDGRGRLHWPLTETIEVRFDAPGLAPSTLRVGPESVLPIEVVLARGCTLAVRVRAPDGSPPPAGLEVTLSATEAPFLGPDGQPQAESAPCGWGGDGDGAYVRCGLDETGRLRFSGLKAGLPLTLALTDAQGFELAPPRQLLLTPDEEQALELTTDGRPRRLLVRVRDAFGRPLPRAWVRVRAAGAEVHQSAVTLTDRAGQALFEAVFAPSVDLDVSHTGFERSVRSGCTLPAEDATLEVALAHDWWPW